jgi:hypothetical protein
MPRPHQQLCVIPDEPHNLPNLDRRKAMAVFKANRIEPKLRSKPLALDMDVRRFIPIRRVEKQPVGSRP